MAVRRASRAMTSLYDRELEAYGITLAQFSLLRNFARLGPMSIGELAEQVKLDRTTLGRNLRPLEKMGAVALVSGESDQRERIVVLTTVGRRLLRNGTAAWKTAQRKIDKTIGREKLLVLNVILNELEVVAT